MKKLKNGKRYKRVIIIISRREAVNRTSRVDQESLLWHLLILLIHHYKFCQTRTVESVSPWHSDLLQFTVFQSIMSRNANALQDLAAKYWPPCPLQTILASPCRHPATLDGATVTTSSITSLPFPLVLMNEGCYANKLRKHEARERQKHRIIKAKNSNKSVKY